MVATPNPRTPDEKGKTDGYQEDHQHEEDRQDDQHEGQGGDAQGHEGEEGQHAEGRGRPGRGPEAKAKAKKHREPKVAPEKAEKKLSQFQAAIKVLAAAGEPMGCKQMVEVMLAKGLWASPTGKTPSQTLYAAILRDLGKGKDARFVKADRGLFALAGEK